MAAVHLGTQSSQAGLAHGSRAALSFPSTKQIWTKEYLGFAASRCIYLHCLERGKGVEEGRGELGLKTVQGWQHCDSGAKGVSLLGGFGGEQSSSCGTQMMYRMPVVLEGWHLATGTWS